MILPFEHTCTIIRPVRAADAYGGFVQTEQTIGTIPCRYSSPTAMDVSFGAAQQAAVSAVIYAPVEADIQAEDIIVIRGRRYTTLEPTSPSKQIYQKLLLTTERI